MGLGAVVKEIWERATQVEASGRAGAVESGARQTLAAPQGLSSIFAPFRGLGVQNVMPKPTAANLRRFAETPVARRAINCIKDKIACLEWRIEARPGAGSESAEIVQKGLPR